MDFRHAEVCWQEANLQRGTQSDLSHGRRKLNLGCASNPRRASDARLRCLRTYDLPMDEEGTARSRPVPTMADLSSKSPRSHCGHGFFTVPTITFSVLYCFFVINHDRRRILHFNVTPHPTSQWITQQLREAFPYEFSPNYLILDRDGKYGLEVLAAIRSLQIRAVRTSSKSPWQNGIAERWVESCRRDLLDHVIAFNDEHLQMLLLDYVRYYHEDRTHLSLGKDTPGHRHRYVNQGPVISYSRLGGLHHRYERAA